MLLIGLIMVRMNPSPTQNVLFRVHITSGMLVLALTIVRLGCRAMIPVPDVPSGITGYRKILFHGIHILQYITIIILIVTGVGILKNSGLSLFSPDLTPQAINTDLQGAKIHSVLSKLLALITIIHIVGGLDYQFRHEDVLSRMGINWFKK